MPTPLTLISHALCPYVQRAAIVLAEKEVPFERLMIDLADKPDWFKAASPLGKVPLLKVGDEYLFESAPIVEFLDETRPPKLHPMDPVERARHRAYVEFASQILNGIGAFYSAKDDTGFAAASEALKTRFRHLETVIDPSGPFFGGPSFSLVDAAFAPVFRYFDVFESFVALDVFDGLDRVTAWRDQLAKRGSVRNAVSADYPDLLRAFLRKRNSWLSDLLAQHERREQLATAC
ncbi:glutathione S-transferase family protein [Roseibium sediminicola]|uniref:glutathione transferase n=1 Tax=Roseibium sediminicola TaxID=2933272 RepID=A0ABT0GMX4_9HYPH|nr:glutathione S-transferase family protein [Roseibium sp. CAU 1639]MCK7610754.1 glutathione S-transferase family protein [Roseibium sp. CAU 1639]